MNSTAAVASKPARTLQEERILVAISAAEQEMFLPRVKWKTFHQCSCLQPDMGSLDAASWERLLRDYRPTVLVSAWSTRALPLAWIDSSDFPLRYVCHLVGSARSLVPRAFLERGGLLTNWGGLAGEAVAEHALLLALSSLRRQPSWPATISAPLKERPATALLGTRTLRGRRVGVHGFGHVAQALVRLLKPFAVEISAFSEGVPPEIMRAAGVAPCASLRELAARSEIFFECEALNPKTIGSVSGSVVASLPDNATFINVGRGPVVDEPALLAAARSSRIMVALDVVVHDPIRADSAFLSVNDAVLSPHIAGPTYDQFPACGQFAMDNLARYLRDEPLEALITPETYDRST